MRIERQDKQPEPLEKEIQENWRTWARLHNFTQRNSVTVNAGEMSILLEVWESSKNAGLIYLPPFFKGGDVLYIADNLNEMLKIVNTLVLGALAMIQVRQEQRESRARLN